MTYHIYIIMWQLVQWHWYLSEWVVLVTVPNDTAYLTRFPPRIFLINFHTASKAIVDIILCPRSGACLCVHRGIKSVLPSGESLGAEFLIASPAPRSPLWESVTSSSKPEVQNISQSWQRRAETRPQATCTENSVKFRRASFLRFAGIQTDRFRHARHHTLLP